MTELFGGDTSDAASIQIKASHSDISNTNSSPRLESNATSSTTCMNDVHPPLGRDLSAELLCPLCDQLFDRPVMVTCGHSYCEPCIERHTRNTRTCVLCKLDVGPLEAMIPSITLDNMVRKVKNQDNMENSSFDDLFLCDEKLQKKEPTVLQKQESGSLSGGPNTSSTSSKAVIRSLSHRSKRRLFFSIAAPTICSSPITPNRCRPLSPSARPIKSSLKTAADNLNCSMEQHASSLSSPPPANYEKSPNDCILKEETHTLFRRNGFGRRSERFTSATMGPGGVGGIFQEARPLKVGLEESDGKLKRNSFFRRSLNVIRSKTGKSFSAKSDLPKVLELPEHSDDQALLESGNSDDVALLASDDSKMKPSSMKSLWKRLFLSKKSSAKVAPKVQLIRHEPFNSDGFQIGAGSQTTISFMRLENQLDDPPTQQHLHLLNSTHFALGYYTGIGRKFERVANGSEITLVVFGHAMAGKTTFVRSIRQLFLEGTDRIRVIPLAERYCLAGIAMMPFPEGDNRLPHIVSLVVNNDADDAEYVLDIIDPEYDNSCLPQAYMDACDAAILLIDSRNCASLLSAHQIHRNMKTAKHTHVQCEMLMNVPSTSSGQSRVLSSNALETTMNKKAATIRELSVNQLDRSTMEEMLLGICKRVRAARKPATPPATASNELP